VLAVSVLDDVDLDPHPLGVRLPGPHPVTVGWATVRAVSGDAEPGSSAVRRRLGVWLRLRRLVADLAEEAVDVLVESSRALALPPGHVDHGGAAWVCETVLGGALDAGVGVVGLLGDPDDVVPLHPLVASAAGADSAAWWPQLRRHADTMGALAAHRLARDAATGRPGVLRPVGGCDVPTLLLSPALRAHLAGGDGSGMRAVAVPVRTRGWYDLARIDPAFVGAAWSATAEVDRGLPRPLLVTADEVRLVSAGGDVVTPVVADPAGRSPDLRDVRYR
jgi:hypothetical protein